MRKRITDMTEKRYGRLVVKEFSHIGNGRNAYWLCQCDCGKTKTIRGRNLRAKHKPTRSCGCLHHEWRIRQNTTHGLSKSPVWRSWKSMKQRCDNPATNYFHIYGGNNITYCNGLNEFESFLNVLCAKPSKQHSIDRTNNDGGYWCGQCQECKENNWPKNVRWATPKQQSRNQHRNRLITFRGRTQCVSAWAEELDIKRPTLYGRLNTLGWSAEKALTTPVKK